MATKHFPAIVGLDLLGRSRKPVEVWEICALLKMSSAFFDCPSSLPVQDSMEQKPS